MLHTNTTSSYTTRRVTPTKSTDPVQKSTLRVSNGRTSKYSENKSTTEQCRVSALRPSTNGGCAAPGATVRDVTFMKMCKAVYLEIQGSIAEDFTSHLDLTRALQRTGFNPSQKKIMRHWRRYSASGTLSFSRFCDIAEMEKFRHPPDLLETFRNLDKDETGLISGEILYNLMTTKGERMSDEEFNSIFKPTRYWRNGSFYYVAFCDEVLKVTRNCRSNAVETLDRLEKQYELNCNTYVVKRKADKTKLDTTISLQMSSHCNGHTNFCIDNIKDWSMCQSRGFFVEADSGEMRSHQFALKLEATTDVCLTIEPLWNEVLPCLSDMAVYVIREEDHTCRQLIAATDKMDDEGRSFFQAQLEPGIYSLLPFTSVPPQKNVRHLPPETSKLVQERSLPDKTGSNVELTAEYKKVLRELFSLIDLDGNGRLSWQEFSFFQMQSCDEDITAKEWNTLKKTFETEEGEMTFRGFETIHEMEAQHSNGDVEQLWNTLFAMGFDEQLNLSSAYPYLLRVYTEEPNPELHACSYKCNAVLLEKAICRAALDRGLATKVRNLNDLITNTYIAQHFATIVVQNKSHSLVTVRLDCSSSKNCLSHRGTLDYLLRVPPKSVTIGHHLFKMEDGEPWQVNCTDSVMK